MLSGKDVQLKCCEIAKGLVKDGKTLEEWEQLIGILNNQDPGSLAQHGQHPRALNAAKLGTILLEFFQNYRTLLDNNFPEPFANLLHMRSPAELLTKEQLDLSRQHMLRAFHLLALHGDVQVVLALCGSEVDRVIFLSPALSCTMRGLERSNARKLSHKTGARITIRPKLPANGFRLILEARGTAPAVSAVEQELERLTIRAARDKVSLMSLSFVQGASLMVFEGSHSDEDHITLEPYYGDNHQSHDNLEPYVPLLQDTPQRGTGTAAELTCRNFHLFKQKFFNQLVAVEQNFVSSVHGELEFVVHFGRVYVFSVPRSFTWDPRPVTVRMLKTNLRRRRRDRLRRPQQSSRPIRFHDENEESRRRSSRRRANRPTDNEVRKKKTKEKPCRSSFFTVVRSRDKAVRFLHSRGFRKVHGQGHEAYNVHFKTDHDFYVKLARDLEFCEVRFPNLRWCLTDVKRKYQESVEDDDADGIEVDMRFLLQSRRALSAEDIRGTPYEKYKEPLKAGADER